MVKRYTEFIYIRAEVGRSDPDCIFLLNTLREKITGEAMPGMSSTVLIQAPSHSSTFGLWRGTRTELMHLGGICYRNLSPVLCATTT